LSWGKWGAGREKGDGHFFEAFEVCLDGLVVYTRDEDADEPERMVWRMERMGSMSQLEMKPLRVLVDVARRFRWGLKVG